MTGPANPPGPRVWMTAVDVFHADGRGTVVTGPLEGDQQLNLGDIAVCEGQRWQVTQISRLRVIRRSAEPGTEVGVVLRNGPPAEVLRGKVVWFEPNIPPDPQPRWKAVGPRKRWRNPPFAHSSSDVAPAQRTSKYPVIWKKEPPSSGSYRPGRIVIT